MSTSHPHPELQPSVSAAELRRKLLALTPPAAGPGPAGPTPETGDSVEEPAPVAPGSKTANGLADLLARLKLPGQAGGSKVIAAPGPRPTTSHAAHPHSAAAEGAPAPAPVKRPVQGRNEPAGSELFRLRNENKELRQLLSEMKQLLQEASETEQGHAQSNVELQTVLAEKTAQVEELNSHLKHFEEQISTGALAPVNPLKSKSELEEWADELERENNKLTTERKSLETERKQLREDEEALEKQMRQMEVSMAKDRAIMARQEMELRRLHAEIQNEIEVMQRGDANLREHMQKFQRRAQEVMTKPAGGGGTTASGMWTRG